MFDRNNFYIRQLGKSWFLYCGPNGRQVDDHHFRNSGYPPRATRDEAILLAHYYNNDNCRSVIECVSEKSYENEMYPGSVITIYVINSVYYVTYCLRDVTYSFYQILESAAHIGEIEQEAILKAHELAAQWNTEFGVYIDRIWYYDADFDLEESDEYECWSPKECACSECTRTQSDDDLLWESHWKESPFYDALDLRKPSY